MIVYGRNLRSALERYEFHVLDLTCYEVCNGLWKQSVKLRRIDSATASKLCGYFKEIVKRYVKVHSVLELDVEEVMRIASEHGITFYDASYVELAREHGMPVVSGDRDVLDSASKLGVKAYDPESFRRML